MCIKNIITILTINIIVPPVTTKLIISSYTH